jgi:hypothetical protein
MQPFARQTLIRAGRSIRCAAMGLIAAGALPVLAQTCPPWEVIPTPTPPDAVQSVIRDLDAIAQNDVWAVGSHHNNSQIKQLAMHWNGSSWTFFDIPVPIASGSGFLWAVAAAGSDDVWAAGDALRTAPDGFTGTHMLVVRWNGTQWNRLETPINSGSSGDLIWDIEIVGPDEVWFVGEGFPVPASSQPPLAMRWKSGSFELLDPPVLNPKVSGFGNGNSFRAIDSLSANDVWVVGAGGDGDPVYDVSQIFHWDGSTWEHRPGPIPGVWHDLNAVVTLSSNDVWAGGEYFDGDSYRGLSMHWDGSSWTQFPVPDSISGFVAFAPDDIFACGGRIMHWDGTAWSTVETFPQVDSPSLSAIDTLGPCEMWTGGRQIIGDSVLNLAARVLPGAPCSADFDGSGFVDTEDYDAFVRAFEAGTDNADVDGSGFVDTDDFDFFVHAFEAGC